MESYTEASAAGESFHAHRDNQRVTVEMWLVDLLDGDLAAALLLSQLLWWFQPAKGRTTPRASHERNDYRWLLRSDDDWWDDCRLTVKQVRRIRSVLKAKGLIVNAKFKKGGAPTTAWRPDFDAFVRLESETSDPIRPNPELPSEGQFRSAPPGSVPIPLDSDLSLRPSSAPPSQDALAGEITKAWWEERKAAGNPPTQSFISVRQVMLTALKNGCDPDLLAKALRRVTAVSGATLAIAIGQLRGGNGFSNSGRPRGSDDPGFVGDDDRDPSGNGPVDVSKI